MIKNKKGFLAVSIIYSFFIVFLLIMLSMLADYLNKKYLKDRIDMPPDKLVYCTDDDTFAHCLIKNEYKQYYEHQGETDYENYAFLGNGTSVVENGAVDYEKMISKIQRTPSNFNKCSTKAEGMYYAQDDYYNSTEKNYSYYYRGNVKNNWVLFAGFKWRIVRINGDGSIRLILTDWSNNTSNSTKNTLTAYPNQATIDKNSIFASLSCVFKYGDTLNTKKNGSLITNFNAPDGNIICNEKNARYEVGIMFNKPSGWSQGISNFLDLKDSVYANDETSTILSTLNSFYASYINSYSDKIANEGIFCADKNVLLNDNSTMTKKLCESYNWGPNQKMCESPLFNWDILSTAHTNIKYYGGINRIFKGTASPKLTCEPSGATAKNNCHKAINLSTYSLKDHGKVKYAFDSSFASGNAWIVDQGKCGEYTTRSYCVGHPLVVDPRWCKSDWKTVTEFKSILYNRLEEAINNGTATYNDSSIIGNGQLLKPIGLLSADEAVMSGSNMNSRECSINSSSVASNQFKNYWTSTAIMGDYNNVSLEGKQHDGLEGILYEGKDTSSSSTYYFVVNDKNEIKMSYSSYLEASGSGLDPLYARPVINIDGNLTGIKGSGTFYDPYVIN